MPNKPHPSSSSMNSQNRRAERTHDPVIENDAVAHPLSYKERYKYTKAQIREVEQKTAETKTELELAKEEIARLWRLQNIYLNRLVERSSPQSLVCNKSSFCNTSTDKYIPKEKRLYKSYKISSKPEALNSSSRKAKSDFPILKEKQPNSRKPRNKRDPEKPRRIQHIPLNEDGSFTLPTQVSVFTIVSLGKIEFERPKFHSERYILPIGYKVLRYFRSTINPDAQTCYTSSILDGITGPKFQVIADDRPDEPFVGDTPSGAWTQILKQASKVRNLQVANSGSGPEYYGLANPTIAYMIQSLPNAKRCKNYLWQKFQVQQSIFAQNRFWPAPPAPSSSTKDDPLEKAE